MKKLVLCVVAKNDCHARVQSVVVAERETHEELVRRVAAKE